MPVQAAQWTEFLSCPICYNEFDSSSHQPISLGCSHTVCKTCLHKLHRKACPFDQTPISTDIDLLPVNCALLQLVGAQVPDVQPVSLSTAAEAGHYEVCRVCVEELALYLKPISGTKGVASLSPSVLSRPMQRKLVTLVNCQLVEEEGRVRAVRACRSLGERTVTELILQHQNPQQLSANLWAAVRARGCQFLGPAMQEDALKLVLLALEDGSALSRKVLVLFVVQKLEARFPQASKTSIGHVVQLLYRASCFKVTKRDEDSSLMQLKEEFRSYEALRREHDAQIVHIAMEAGLRISPEQWSSLLYGDLVHKSHMQSIIDKLQSPESFAKSVQELTIVLQRTADPANLTSLRPHLELLANIDHNPDAPSPSWEELESVTLAVKLVVHGLVEFTQNFSKKSHDPPQPQANSKYKTSMCRDLRQQGGCPRGTNCTFAHTQDELEKFRLRNKKSSCVGRAFPLAPGVMNKTFSMEAGIHTDVSAGVGPDLKGATENAGAKMEGVPSLAHQSLISRGTDGKRLVPNGINGGGNGVPGTNRASAGSSDPKPASPPGTPASLSSSSSPLSTVGRVESGAPLPRHSHFILPSPHPSQVSELYYQEPHPAFDTGSYYQSSLHPPHKPCMARFLRSSNVPESALPPSMGPSHSLYPNDPQAPHSPTSTGYPLHSPRDRMGAPVFHSHPGQPQYGPMAHTGVYAPLYDSRRVWRPQLYHREDPRSNSLPPEVLHSSVYQPPLRERFNSLDSNYCSGSEHRTGLHRVCRKNKTQGKYSCFIARSSVIIASLILFKVPLRSPFDLLFRGEDSLAHYSPWSCGSVGPCRSPFEPESGGVNGVGKRWLPSLDHCRRLKDEDPIIPFSEGPIISKWGAISRASRTGYHTTDPVQATACQGRASSTTPLADLNMNPRSVHFSEHLYASDLHGRRTSVSSGDKNLCDLKAHQTPFSHTRDESEPDPDRDIELELRTLNMEDSEPQDVKSQVVFFSPPKVLIFFFFFFFIHLILSMWRDNLKKTPPVSLNPSSFMSSFSLRSLLIWRAHNLRMLPTSYHLPAYPPSFHPLQRSSPKQRIQ
uniref:RING-type E3 ubiquitin transferase n=1 Tax=Oryzias sinensis TaxID=183150 RepID=A0A8C7Z328_9TELE